MRIVILGATGQLGQDLVRADTDHELVPLGRDDLDLARTDRIVAALADHQFDVIINCAGYTRVDDAERDPAAARLLNAHAPRAIAQACAARATRGASGPRMVQISTDFVFDGEAGRPYHEGDRTAPINVYGRSKAMGEELVRNEHPQGSLIVRTASLFGLAAARGTARNFIETIIRKGSEEGARLRVVHDVVMSPTSTADLARAILALLDADAPAGIYHIANRGQATWHQLARRTLELEGIEARVDPVPAGDYPTLAPRPRFTVLDCGKAEGIVGEMRGWEEALVEYLAGRRSMIDDR